MRKWLEIVAWVAVMSLLMPQLFVMSYFFPLLIKGVDRLSMLREMALLGLVIAWISAPFFFVAVLLYRAMVSLRVRWYVVFPLCVLSGYLLVVAWNLFIFDLFSYGRAALPVLVCCLVSAGYALARDFYFRTLPPPPKAKSEDAGTGAQSCTKETQRREDAKNQGADRS